LQRSSEEERGTWQVEREELVAREKAARAEAEAERQCLERLFRAAPALVNIHRGPEHVLELVHPLTFKLLGGQRELIGKPVREAIPELEGQGFFELLDRVYQTGEPAHEKAKPARLARSETGEWEDVFFDCTWQPMFDAQGRVEGVMTFAVDVTEQVHARRQAEALAAEAERLARQVEEERGRLEAVLQQMPQGVIIADAPSGRLLLGNRQVERILRYPFFPSSDIKEYTAYRGLHPDGRSYEPHEWPLARAITAGEVVQDEVLGVLRGDGTRGTLEVSASPVRDEQGRVTAGVVVFNDITERKAAADTAAFLAQASSTLASSLDYTATLSTTARLAVPTLCDWCMVDLEQPDGTFHRVAVAYEDPMLAPLAEEARRFPPSPEGARGHPPTLVALRKMSVLVEEVNEAWLEKAALNEAHHRQMKAIGFHSIMSVPLVARGRALGVLTFLAIAPGRRFTRADLGTAEELARRAALAVDNARLYAEAQQAVRLRDEFLSVASHELKTPLTPLSLKLQVLAREAEAQGGSPFAQRVLAHVEAGRRQVKKLSELIGDLLDVSRISAGRMRLDLDPVELVALVGEVASRFEPEAGRVGCKLVLHTHGSLCGSWDRLRLEQVVSNLLSNALKYGAGRPIHLHVEAAGDRALLLVRDEGIGIEPQAQERIFEKFERAVSERNYGGLGLGLFITRQIVEALGGHIQVSSVPGQGATFTVELPLVSPPRPEAR